jgi:hypothetical protein
MADFGNVIQDPMLQGLIEIVSNSSVFMKLLKFIETETLAYRYDREQSLPGIAFRNVNGVYGDQDPGVINPEVETLAVFGGPVKTDTRLANPKVRRNKVMSKIRNAGLFFDYNVLNGDPSKNPASFLGIIPRLGTSQVVSAGTNGGALVLDQVVQVQDKTVGTDNAQKPLLMNKATRRQLSSQVRSEARGMGVFDASGTQIIRFNDSPIVVFDEYGYGIVDASGQPLQIPPVIGNTETWGTATTATSLYCMYFGQEIDEEGVQGIVQMLPAPLGVAPGGAGDGVGGGDAMTPIQYKDVGDFGEYYKELVEGAMTIGVFHPRAVTRYAGILDQTVG